MLNYVQAKDMFGKNIGFKNMHKVRNRDNGGILRKQYFFFLFSFCLIRVRIKIFKRL